MPNTPVAIPASHRAIPLSEAEVRALIEENERLRNRVLECEGLLQTGRNLLRDRGTRSTAYWSEQARIHVLRATKYLSRPATPLSAIAADTNVDQHFRQILATGQKLSAYGRPDHDLSTSGMPLKEGT